MVLIINFIYAGLFLTKLKRTSHKCIKKKGAKKHTQTLKQGKKKNKNLYESIQTVPSKVYSVPHFWLSWKTPRQDLTASACMAYKHAHQFHAEPTQLRMCEG